MATDLASSVSLDLELPSFSLLGKKAFVTGGSRGIGRAIALAPGLGGSRRRDRLERRRRRAGRGRLPRDPRAGPQGRGLRLRRRRAGRRRDHVRRGQGRLRDDRHPGQQRRHHPRPVVQEDGPRRLGRGDQHQPQQRLRHHPAVHRRHGRARLGPRHQHLEHRGRDRQLRPGQLRRRQGRH